MIGLGVSADELRIYDLDEAGEELVVGGSTNPDWTLAALCECLRTM